MSLVVQYGSALQVELFASPLDQKHPVYFSPFPKAKGTDALVQDWNLFLQVLIFPPSNPIKGVAKKLIAYKGECWSFRTPGPCSASFQPSSSARDWRWTRRSIDCTRAASTYRMGTIAFARGFLKAVYLSS